MRLYGVFHLPESSDDRQAKQFESWEGGDKVVCFTLNLCPCVYHAGKWQNLLENLDNFIQKAIARLGFVVSLAD
jgi:hypothetical protein